MKRRPRKKLQLREFQERGFHVSLSVPYDNEDERLYEFWGRLVEVVEARNLSMGGALNNFFVAADGRRTATEAGREALATWLGQQPDVSAVVVGPLVDAWHSWDKKLPIEGDVPTGQALHILARAGIALP